MKEVEEKKENKKQIAWSGRGKIPKYLRTVVVPKKSKKKE